MDVIQDGGLIVKDNPKYSSLLSFLGFRLVARRTFGMDNLLDEIAKPFYFGLLEHFLIEGHPMLLRIVTDMAGRQVLGGVRGRIGGVTGVWYDEALVDGFLAGVRIRQGRDVSHLEVRVGWTIYRSGKVV